MEICNGTYCVYVHTNKVNGKKYVGQTVNGNNPKKRWDNGNGYKGCTYFYKSIQKYGWDNFEHEIIANNLAAQEADNFEKLLIEKLDTRDPNNGYNLESGGTKNKELSEETKKKIRVAKIGKSIGPRSEETRRKISESNKGKIMSDECRHKLSESQKLYWQNEDYMQNQIEKHKWQTGEKHPWYNREHKEETKNKIGEANTKFRVFCIELNMTFDSSEDAKRKTEIDASDIRKVCKGMKSSAGKHPVTGEKLHWIFVEKEVN